MQQELDSLNNWWKDSLLQDSTSNCEPVNRSSAEWSFYCGPSQKSLSFTSFRVGKTSPTFSVQLLSSNEFLRPPLCIGIMQWKVQKLKQHFFETETTCKVASSRDRSALITCTVWDHMITSTTLCTLFWTLTDIWKVPTLYKRTFIVSFKLIGFWSIYSNF